MAAKTTTVVEELWQSHELIDRPIRISHTEFAIRSNLHLF